jgi:hypothetical protein
MGGSIFTISGTTGGDLVKVVSYLISEDNLGADKNTIILGNVKQYLNQCFNHEGKILEELGLGNNDMNYFEKLKQNQIKLEEYNNQFNDILFKFVYSEYKDELEQRSNYATSDLKLVGSSDIKFSELLDKYNEYAETNHLNEKWVIGSTSTETCDSTNRNEGPHGSAIEYDPKKCYPTIKSSYSSNLASEQAKLNEIKDLVEKANNGDSNSISKKIEDLSKRYDDYLKAEITALGVYIEKIKKITEIVKDYTSEDDELFSFMNCAFIKDNVEVILFYLKNSFKNDMYEVGVYLLIAAFSMPFGISFTILLIMISNDEIATNLEKEEEIKKRKSQSNINPIQEVKIDNNENNGGSTEKRALNKNS